MGTPIRVIDGSAKPYEPFWQARPAAKAGDPAEIDFFGYISEFSWFDDEITPKKFKDDLQRVGQGGPVTIRMHSGGGEVFAAAAIRGMLVEYPGRITVKILGLAASAAVAIALAGDEIQIYDTAYMMVHNPGYQMLLGYLTADVLRKYSEELDLFREGLLNAYQARTGSDRETLAQLMDAETWMTAQQAVELGFADQVVSGGQAPAQINAGALSNYSHVPPALLQLVNSGQAPVVEPPSVPSESPVQAHRARLEAARNIHQGEPDMSSYLRTLLAQRDELLGKAQKIVDTADAETRDLTAEERTAFELIMGEGETTGELAELDARIEQAIAERERLRQAAARKFGLPAETAVKPEAGKRAMKRADFDKLNRADQAEFIRAGGKVED